MVELPGSLKGDHSHTARDGIHLEEVPSPDFHSLQETAPVGVACQMSHLGMTFNGFQGFMVMALNDTQTIDRLEWNHFFIRIPGGKGVFFQFPPETIGLSTFEAEVVNHILPEFHLGEPWNYCWLFHGIETHHRDVIRNEVITTSL
jgi:hypothetical protein